MSISVLSQHSVDRLRVLVKSGEQILSRSFDEIIEAYSLQTVDLDIEFDSSVELLFVLDLLVSSFLFRRARLKSEE